MTAGPFEAAFGRPPEAAAAAPGRVNLIGEHIDYTGGTVLPTVIPARVTVALAAGGDAVRVASASFGETASRAPDEGPRGHWSDYVLAGHQAAARLGLMPPGGAAYHVSSDIPAGAGVSSSAALLVALLRAAAARAGRDEAPETLARWAQVVERDVIGVPSGIMDQMAVAAGRPGHAMALDTRTLAFEQLTLPPGYAFPVVHSGLARKLTDGGYADRRAACEAAARALGLEGLEGLSPEGPAILPRIDALDEPLRRRARHAVTEHARVLAAADALRAGDTPAFGRLMDESHASMRDDFEIVPGPMDAMVAHARTLGALGARLTGGGFGGCFVACVPDAEVDAWAAGLLAAYPDAWLVTDGRAAASRRAPPRPSGTP